MYQGGYMGKVLRVDLNRPIGRLRAAPGPAIIRSLGGEDGPRGPRVRAKPAAFDRLGSLRSDCP